MKQMSLIEMDGFLKGKCIPRDLKVNETNAEYLVRKFGELESKLETALRECRSTGITIDNLEAKCEALAAENARLKSAVTQQIELRAEIKKAGRPPHADFWVQSICEAEEKVKRALEETQATDAFLDEVRAQGVEMFADHLLCPDLDDTIRDFAAQLRKGGNQ
ncbi:hNH endonuclease [Escherichia coli]|nr:hNH endonuclease [Escherichia coli]MBW1555056.1 hNH endonuclease [Escherichia coli]MCH6835260.1 hNH endonuclease [Escherichia coli]